MITLTDFLNKTNYKTITQSFSSNIEYTKHICENEINETTLFSNIKDGNNNQTKVVLNIFSSHQKISQIVNATNTSPAECIQKNIQSYNGNKSIQIEEISGLEDYNKLTGLDCLIIPKHFPKDGGKYITSGILYTVDPDTGKINSAIHRMQINENNEILVCFTPSGDNYINLKKNIEKHGRMDCYILIGHHPLIYISGLTKTEYDVDDYILLNCFSDKVKYSNTKYCNFPVINGGEIYIFGTFYGNQKKEGPMGDYTHNYSEKDNNPVMSVTNVLVKKDFIYMDIIPGTKDHHFLEEIMMEIVCKTKLKEKGYDEINIYFPPSGCCQMLAYVNWRDYYPYSPKKLGELILSIDKYFKYVIIVNDDIDILNEEKVLWAICTRAAFSDFISTKSGVVNTMDPIYIQTGNVEKCIIDATTSKTIRDKKVEWI